MQMVPRLSLALGVLSALLLIPGIASARPAPDRKIAASPSQSLPHKPAAEAWANKLGVSAEGGHMLGNPAAEHKLVEFMSYTCSHCAHFEMESALALRMGPISAGHVSFEVRHLLRDPVDVAAAVLTNCVPPVKFFPLHHKFLAEQPKWLAVAQGMNEEQLKRWNAGQMPERLRAIASDLKFYDIAESAGLTRVQADACFANQAILARVVAQTRAAQALGVDSTPSFVLDGTLLKDEHDWASLQKRLAAVVQ